MIQFFLPIFTTIGPFVSKIVTSLLANLPTIVETALKVMKVISVVVDAVAHLKNIIPEDETSEELGAKTLQKGTRPREDGESIDDYLNYLRNEVELDVEKMNSMSDEDKLKCYEVGTGLVSEAISQKSGVVLSGDFLIDIEKMKLSGETLSKYIDDFSKNGIDSMDYLTKYLRGDLNVKDSEMVQNVIKQSIKDCNPGYNNGQVLHEINEMKNSLE